MTPEFIAFWSYPSNFESRHPDALLTRIDAACTNLLVEALAVPSSKILAALFFMLVG